MTTETDATRQDDQQQLPLDPQAGEQSENFEALYTRLEEVTQHLEAGGLSLEQSVSLYEEGVELARRSHELLGGIEQRIETLRQIASGDEG